MSVGKVVQLLTRLQGSQGTVTLGRRQIAKGLQKMGATEKGIIQIFSEFQNPKLHVSYKGSEQGFTVATAKLMDGKQVIANGAISTNGTGLDNLKVRLNVGENGKYCTASAWLDLAKEFKCGSFKTNLSIEDGVWQFTPKIGDNIGGYVKFNAKDSLDDLKKLAVKHDPSAADELKDISYDSLMKKASDFMNKYLSKIKTALKDNATAKDIKPEKVKNKSLKDLFDIKIKPSAEKTFDKIAWEKICDELKD